MVKRFLGFGLAALLVACGSTTDTNGNTNSSSSSSGTGAAAGSGGQGGDGQGGVSSQGGGGQGGQGQGGLGQGGLGQGGLGQGGASTGIPCTWALTNPCPNGEYCNAPGCGAGKCEAIVVANDPNKAAVCGCDDVNYWNATTAAVHGMATKGAGSCVQPTFCGGFGNIQCPMAAHYCDAAVNSQGECLISDPGGFCWGMPKSCAQIGFGGNRRPCGSPAATCLEECDAIKTEMTHYQDNSCPM